VIPATPEQQRGLLALQQVDTAIRQLEHRRAHLPEQQALDENADTLKRVSVEYAGAKDELEQLEFKQQRLETEISTVDSRRKSEEGRMYGGMISSDRELEALRNELSSLRARKNDLEDDLIETMERVEELTSLVTTLEERHTELTSSVASLTAARDEAAKDIDSELVDRRAEREQAAGPLDARLLARYAQLRERGRGIGVAELSGRTCQGCNLDLTIIELEEAREEAPRGLPSCPQCDRLLVLN
jgi:predicted  nucleic acid-binding Zn-ribbon protein